MKITKQQAISQNWDDVRSWNYKLKHLDAYQSVVYAELDGDHGEVTTKELERVYFILEGNGKFQYGGQEFDVSSGDVITVPPHTRYDYRPTDQRTLKVLLFMELWDN